jgi:hypothetical protein
MEVEAGESECRPAVEAETCLAIRRRMPCLPTHVVYSLPNPFLAQLINIAASLRDTTHILALCICQAYFLYWEAPDSSISITEFELKLHRELRWLFIKHEHFRRGLSSHRAV